MKNITKVLIAKVKKAADASLRRDANTTTCSIIYQPKAPANLKKYKK